MSGRLDPRDVIASLYATAGDNQLSWLDGLLIDAGYMRRCLCTAMTPADERCTVCGAAEDDEGIESCFGTYRCSPEAVFQVPALSEGDPELTISIAAAGGGTVGETYADNTWIYDVHLAGQLVMSGADLRSGGIPQSHQDMAGMLACWLADSYDTPKTLIPQRDRLSCWSDDIEQENNLG